MHSDTIMMERTWSYPILWWKQNRQTTGQWFPTTGKFVTKQILL